MWRNEGTLICNKYTHAFSVFRDFNHKYACYQQQVSVFVVVSNINPDNIYVLDNDSTPNIQFHEYFSQQSL